MSALKELSAAVEAKPTTPLDTAYAALKKPLLVTVLITFFSVALSFASYIYMIQLSERAIATRSFETFAALTVMVMVATLVDVLLDNTKSKLLKAAGTKFYDVLAPATFDAVHRAGLIDHRHNHQQALRDVASVRDFVTGSNVTQMMQIPYVPLFLLAVYFIHPALVVFMVVAVGLISLFTYLGERASKEQMKYSADAKFEAQVYASALHRHADVVHALGMRGALRSRWYERERESAAWQASAEQRQQVFMSMAKFVRAASFVGVLAMNAYLIMNQLMAPSMLVVGGLIVNRGLGPLEALAAQLRSNGAFRLANLRLRALFEVATVPPSKVRMSRPSGRLTVENLIVAAPGAERGATPILRNVSFDVPPGSCLAIVGPSSSGKSSLARVLVGAWRPLFGTIRLDGFELSQWDEEQLGGLIGYLPQEVGLFAGTVAENIGRFQHNSHEAVVAAAKLADVEELIGMLPEGYNTVLGEGGSGLSGGQRQRIGMARAVFGMPVLVVLDEPNANLDASGEGALVDTIQRLKAQGTTVVFITHKANLLGVADFLLTLGGGGVQAYGTREEVMKRLTAPRVVQIQAQPT